MSINSTHVTLAADLLAMRARQLLTTLAAHHFEPLDQLRDALDTYSAVRAGGAPSAPSFVNCERCRLAGVCLTPGESNCTEFEPVTLRSLEVDSSSYARAVAFESEQSSG